MSGTCAVVGCGEARAGSVFCEEHAAAYYQSPEWRRADAYPDEPTGKADRHYFTTRADFARRVSLESQRDRETREGEQQ